MKKLGGSLITTVEEGRLRWRIENVLNTSKKLKDTNLNTSIAGFLMLRLAALLLCTSNRPDDQSMGRTQIG
jgi:hypothetical protein